MNNTQALPQTYRPSGAATSFWRAFSAEALKMKRTLALWLTLLAPLVIAGMQFFLFLDRAENLLADEANAWVFIGRQNLTFWALLMQPLFVTLETALVAQLDHSGDHWRRLFALPLPRWAIYFAKLVINTLLIGLSLLALTGYTVVTGLLFRVIKPGLGFEGAIPFTNLLWMALLVFASSWITIALHAWVSLYWRSFVVACAFGITMTIAGMFAINTEYGGYYPWTLSAVLINNFDRGLPYLNLLTYGCLGGLALAVIGCWLFTRKEVL